MNNIRARAPAFIPPTLLAIAVSGEFHKKYKIHIVSLSNGDSLNTEAYSSFMARQTDPPFTHVLLPRLLMLLL